MQRPGRNLSLIAPAVALWLAAGAAPAAAKPGGAEKGIAEMNLAIVAAYNGGDAGAVAACYTEDAVIYPPDLGSIAGREAIQEFWQGAMTGGMTGLQIETDEIEAKGDTAFETGRYEGFNTLGENIDQGKYIVVWKRVEGTWRLHRDIWNSGR